MNRYLLIFDKLVNSERRIYFFGVIPVMVISIRSAIQLSYNNFQIFSFGCLDFWFGNNPYQNWNHISLAGKPLDVFLYSPQFSILFTPFALLPGWLGLLLWNLVTYTLLFFSVFSLPHQFSFIKKRFIFFYTSLLLLQTIFAEQFNPVVAALFLFSFTLLEKEKGFWAVLLILLSGFTKIYGIFQIGIILFYPKIWKNSFYAIIIGIVLFLLPLVKIPANMLIDYYETWIQMLIRHGDPGRYDNIYRPIQIFWNSIKYLTGLISIGILVSLYSLALYNLRIFKETFLYRVRFLGLIMGWAILFGTSSERNTYLIAVIGYTIWYQSFPAARRDKILLWINFILLAVAPIDILFPPFVSDFLLGTLNMGVIIFALTWCIMIYKTFIHDPEIQER